MIFNYSNSKKFTSILSSLFFICFQAFSQDDSLLVIPEPVNYIRTFDGTRVINGQSTENMYEQELQFMISHRFGPVSGGIHTLYGLDQSNVRLGFDYGISNR